MEAFDASVYASQLAEVQRKLNTVDELKESISKTDAQVLAIRAEKKAQANRLLEYKKTIDLRSEAKNDRDARTEYLRGVGILLPNECIAKVREPREKQE
jgi:hypothetical protein